MKIIFFIFSQIILKSYNGKLLQILYIEQKNLLMLKNIPENLFTLEIANNHMGDVEHGIYLIRSFSDVCKKYPFHFGFKFQYRELDTFIHPSMKNREDVKYIKRFSETKLSKNDFDKMIAEVHHQGFLTISTPFDEDSVNLIESQDLDIIKIASCSFTDWPLLERIVKNNKPIIASTAGSSINEIDQVVSFFSHRKKEFALMHCVAEYPTPDENTHLSQIRYSQQRHPNVRIGFSTHENPSDNTIISMAIALGASIFERHIAVSTEKYSVNNYSSTPEQIDVWLSAALHSTNICGIGNERLPLNNEESNNLRSLRRGVYVKKHINKGKLIKKEDIYFAFPPQDNQYTANDWSKYQQYETTKDINKDGAVKKDNTKCQDTREKVWEIVKKVRIFLKNSETVIPGGVDLEISHHYGLENFDKFGLLIFNVVNRNYCKKLLVILPGQSHPEQYHKQKEETFHVLFGEITLELDGKLRTCIPGDVITILSKVRHTFSSKCGAVIEEISTTHHKDDSYYSDPAIMENNQRKTLLTYWME